jgi:hypothetical protein
LHNLIGKQPLTSLGISGLQCLGVQGEHPLNPEEFYEKVIRRLDVLIALQLEKSQPGLPATVTDKILRLAEIGLNSGEIGQVVNKPANYVTAVKSAKKKGGVRH